MFRRLLEGLDRALTVTLVAAMAAMVIVVSAQVALRYGFNRSIDWADEIGRLAFVWSIFLAVPLGVRHGAHIGIDLLADALPEALRKSLKRTGAALCAILMFVIAWAALGVAREQWDELMATVDWSVGWFVVPVGLGALMSALHMLEIALSGPPRSAGSVAE